MIVVVLRQCESLDSRTIATALELTIELGFDDIFDQLIDYFPCHQYQAMSIGISRAVRSTKVKPHHLRTFRQTDSSQTDLLSITWKCSNELLNFASHQSDIDWIDAQLKAALTEAVKSDRIDNAAAIARRFSRVWQMSRPEYRRSPEFLHRKLVESDWVFDEDRIQSKSV
jgi:hypothetical protein